MKVTFLVAIGEGASSDSSFRSGAPILIIKEITDLTEWEVWVKKEFERSESMFLSNNFSDDFCDTPQGQMLGEEMEGFEDFLKQPIGLYEVVGEYYFDEEDCIDLDCDHEFCGVDRGPFGKSLTYTKLWNVGNTED